MEMKFFKKALLINLTVIFAILVGLTLFFITPWGKSVAKTVLLTTEAVPDFPIRPLQTFTKDPKIEEVTIKTVDGKEIKADLYRPPDNKKYPAIVLTVGTIVTRKDAIVTKFSQALSRVGFVVLVPDLPDFLSGFVWTDSVNTLISSVEFLDGQPYVNKNKIGFVGFCVGASVSILAAEDQRIADKVAYISAISPYFDLIGITKAITSRYAENTQGELKPWESNQLSTESVVKGYSNYLGNERERELLINYFLKGEEIPSQSFEGFSEEAKSIYDLLANRDQGQFNQVFKNLPQELQALAAELSPSTKIDNLKAKMFVLNDKKDTFVPEVEGVKLAKSLPKSQIYFVEIDSFEHVNPKTRLPRWAAIKQIFNLSVYIYRVFWEVDSR